MKEQQGFTLIEILVYLGLFTILVGGAVLAAYNVIESNGRNQTLALVQQEANFLTGKINWALTGIDGVNQPPAPNSPALSKLAVTKSDSAVGEVDINLDDSNPGDIQLRRSGGEYHTLNSSNITVSNLLFNYESSENGAEWVKATFTLSAKTPDGHDINQDFSTVKYLRK